MPSTTIPCPFCGTNVASGTRLCPSCGKPLDKQVEPHNRSNGQNPVPTPRGKKILFLIPMLAAGLVGFVIGYFNGVAGLIVSLAVGLILSIHFVKHQSIPKVLSSLPKLLLTPSFIAATLALIGSILFVAVFSTPITSGGLYLPTGHNPKSFAHYMSLIAVFPENFIKGGRWSIFPGHPAIVVPGIIIMVLGAILPEKWVSRPLKFILKIVGLVILTAAPSISYNLMDGKGAVPFDYTWVYYLAWAGIVLDGLSQAFPFLMKHLKPIVLGGGMYTLLFAIPLIIPLVPLFHLRTPTFIWCGNMDFETAHDLAAGLFAGGVSGAAGASIVANQGSSETDLPDVPDMPDLPDDAGPKDGETRTVTDPRGQEMDITFNAKDGQWHTDSGSIIDPGKLDQTRADAAKDKEFNDADRKNQINHNTAIDRSLTAIGDKAKAEAAQTQQNIDTRNADIRKDKEAYREKWSAEGASQLDKANSADRWVKGAEVVQKGADMGIDGLAKVTGPVGKQIKYGYIATKALASNVSEANAKGQSLMDGAVKGAKEAVVDCGIEAGKEILSNATGGNVPGLKDFKAADLTKVALIKPTSITESLVKEAVINNSIKAGVKDAIQSQAQNLVTDPLKAKMGFGSN